MAVTEVVIEAEDHLEAAAEVDMLKHHVEARERKVAITDQHRKVVDDK